ncbi:hypothetical protein [Alkalicoccobacillus plakortidis]|uniref:Uncharacterized protein n=1 Tax=Alkalicoccobacillus plakortidis TaxID=444060 RepID=A0ABT0XHU6_9BACI|nr:hypothetical protein [Alkalicoccobacillus plakortidis]MCM2675476.1 hypothetical protein [Alkalicoccobacillus plakortidis]
MYKVTRTVKGVTETLKDSNSHLDKTFTDSVAAELLAKKLNANTLMNTEHWTVQSVSLTSQ